jgi:uncharacterized membrane protein SpoIIM required for sporulation
VDVDAFIAGHAAEWARLDDLARRRRISADEADELVVLYRRVATHLSLVQSRAPDPALAARLSRLLARARGAVVGTPAVRGWTAMARGVTETFPVAVYRTWRWSVGMVVANLAVAAAMMLWLRDHPDRLNHLLSSDSVRQLVDRDFADYYSAHPAHSFAAQVWTNNALVTALALFLGVTLVGTLYVMLQNTINLGVVGGAMLGAGKGDVFFGLILPHGMLELTVVFIAGGAGLRLGWAWVAPGLRTRSDALAEAGRSAGVITLGLAGALLVSGVIEAFVTPSGLPTWARIGVGAVAEVAFVAYVVVLGRRGVRAGATGDVADALRGDLVPTA